MYREKIRPVLDYLDRTDIEMFGSESMHIAAREGLHLAQKTQFFLEVLEKTCAFGGRRLSDPGLAVRAGGVDFDVPVILGAGWDKVARSILAWYVLNFGGAEFGAVPAMEQPGNPRKRQFILAPGVPLNRLGFNSPGMHAVQNELEGYKRLLEFHKGYLQSRFPPFGDHGIPVGANLGINKEITPKEAPVLYRVAAKGLAPYVNYLVLNVSSPNTPGLRDLQHKNSLEAIIGETKDGLGEIGYGGIPIFVKVSDLPFANIYDVGEVVAENELAGMICINTTTDLKIKAKYGERWRNEAGGLSGNDPDYRQKVFARVAFAYREFGQNFDVMGVGSVNSPQVALELMMAGAKVVQIVSGIRERGTKLPGEIVYNLSDWRVRNGVKNIADIVGINAHKYPAI